MTFSIKVNGNTHNVDVDGDTSTYSSSSARVDVPGCLTRIRPATVTTTRLAMRSTLIG
jgi:hypothetical protein